MFDMHSEKCVAPNRLSSDGFKCHRTENELQSAVCHHWLMANSHGGKLEAANSCGFSFCFGCSEGETQLLVVVKLRKEDRKASF